MNAHSHTRTPLKLNALGLPLTDSFADPLIVSDYYRDAINAEFDGEVLASFDVNGDCSEYASPTLVALTFVVRGTHTHMTADDLPNDFAMQLEAVAQEEMQ